MQLYNTLSAAERAVMIDDAGKQRLTLSFYAYAQIKNPTQFRNELLGIRSESQVEFMWPMKEILPSGKKIIRIGTCVQHIKRSRKSVRRLLFIGSGFFSFSRWGTKTLWLLFQVNCGIYFPPKNASFPMAFRLKAQYG